MYNIYFKINENNNFLFLKVLISFFIIKKVNLSTKYFDYTTIILSNYTI